MTVESDRSLSIFWRITGTLLMVSVFFVSPPAVSGAGVPETVAQQLERIYDTRRDLQQAFRPDDWTAIPSAKTSGLADLEDWARKYGYKEYPDLLAGYAPAAVPAAETPTPKPLVVRKTALAPLLKDGAQFDFSKLTADAVFVVDVASREVLLARNSRTVRTMASITKLMTAAVALDHKISFARMVTMAKEDDVGGAKLQAAAGTRLSTADLFYAMIVGSANNAANAIARSTGLSTADFVAAMNDEAAAIGLASTHFVDTSGMDPANVSTAEEIGALALEVFEKYYYIRRSASTAKYEMILAGQKHTIKSTNELLTDDTNGLIVTGGKTGYLEESQWNLAVKMMDYRGKTLVVVVLGSDSKKDVFRDAATAARWVWNNYRWVRR